jgi:hypothetical protein
MKLYTLNDYLLDGSLINFNKNAQLKLIILGKN